MTYSERIINELNLNIFFREFSFSKNQFKNLDDNQKVEFADNVVWLDDLLFLYQIKEQDMASSNSESWFINKVEKKAVKQIKVTLNYLYNQSEVIIENERGHKINITQAKSCNNIKKIIIYKPKAGFPLELQRKKFYDSSEIGLIHLFSYDDYKKICEYLVTPGEINEYLNFREKLFITNKIHSNLVDETYFIAQFLENNNNFYLDVNKIHNIKYYSNTDKDLGLSYFINVFEEKLLYKKFEVEYYPVIIEIAKLDRKEIKEFKGNLIFAIQTSKNNKHILSKIFYSVRTKCSFTFIVVPYLTFYKEEVIALYELLINKTNNDKQNNNAKTAVGIIVFRGENYIDMDYFYIN